MHKILFATICLGALVSLAFTGTDSRAAEASIGKAAPDFTLTGADGKNPRAGRLQRQVRGAGMDQPGMPVRPQVLRFRHDAETAEDRDRQGVVWLRINSSAEGHEGYHPSPISPLM